MKRLIAATVLFLSWSVALPDEAPTASHMNEAERLLEAMDFENTMLSGASATADTMIQQNPMLKPYRDVLIHWAKGFMTWEVMGPPMAKLYANSFSEKELRDLISFYSTPTGKKLVSLQEGIFRDSMIIGAEEAQKRVFQLEMMISERAEELSESME